MRRLAAVLILFVLLVPSKPFHAAGAAVVAAAAQNREADGIAAANVAVELSVLEGTSDFHGLYDRIHPDAHAVIPRAAAIGWFQNEFAPRGPGVSTVTGVRFVSWTWAVTGETYPYTAEVSFLQPFTDGSVVQDVVRLVQDENGEWRWFFGRSRDFIDEQISRYVAPVPVQSRSMSVVDVAIADVNEFWAFSFQAAGLQYVAPTVVEVRSQAGSSCGTVDIREGPAFYCPTERKLFYSPEWFSYYDGAIGDFAWVTIIAHEWGHHVQALSGRQQGQGNAHELQADCLGGSYARDAETRGLLDPGDVTEAVAVSAMSGDPVWLPQDGAGTHGTSDDRIAAFMSGFLGGFLKCGFMLSQSDAPASEPRGSVPDPNPNGLLALLPRQGDVPADLLSAGDQQRSLNEVASNYINPLETEALFAEWGWEGNVTRSYEGNGESSGITSVYVSAHRFGDSQNAANALDYSFNDQAVSTGAREIPVAQLATTSRALATTADVTIYVQQGDLLIRLTVTS
jgi:hypothetical protein